MLSRSHLSVCCLNGQGQRGTVQGQLKVKDNLSSRSAGAEVIFVLRNINASK